MNSQASRKVKASSASTTSVHAGEERRVEREHAAWRLLVLAVADGVEAGARPAETRHDEKEGRKRIDAEVGADPGQADGQVHAGRGWGAGQQMRAGGHEDDEARGERDQVDGAAREADTVEGYAKRRRNQQRGDRPEHQDRRHPSQRLPVSRRSPACLDQPDSTMRTLAWA